MRASKQSAIGEHLERRNFVHNPATSAYGHEAGSYWAGCGTCPRCLQNNLIWGQGGRKACMEGWICRPTSAACAAFRREAQARTPTSYLPSGLPRGDDSSAAMPARTPWLNGSAISTGKPRAAWNPASKSSNSPASATNTNPSITIQVLLSPPEPA